MLEALLINPVHAISVLGLLWVRCTVCLSITNLFGMVGVPRSLRLFVATVMALWLWPMAGGIDDVSGVPQISQAVFVVLLIKDAAIGFLLGFTLALPLWMMEGVGAFFDNQRGAMTGQTFNPLLASPSPMATLLQLAAIVVLHESGGLRWACEYIALGARLWPPHSLLPPPGLFDQETLIQLFNGMARGTLLYFAPLLAVMMLMEVAMALLSLYAPHMQAFQLAMPLKSLVGLLVLVLLLGVLFDLWSQEAMKYLKALVDAMLETEQAPAFPGGGLPRR